MNPIIVQPSADMNFSTSIGVPIASGLEYLVSVDQLLVQQKIELLEAITGFETKNKFLIKNTLGQNVFWAAEDSDCFSRNCCGNIRPFGMKIYDASKTEVMHLYRPLACNGCCFPCCLQSIEVSAPPGCTIGRIEQVWTWCYPHFVVKNSHGEIVLRIEGPLCQSSCGGDVIFKICSMEGIQIGNITKQWSGLVREMFTDADSFSINFPMDLAVELKAILLGACILIDAMFFEQNNNGRMMAFVPY